jgi:hypothetical protein
MGGEEKGIVNRVRPFYSRQRRLARSADLELGGENGSRGESVSTDGDERGGVQQCWTPGKKKKDFMYIYDQSPAISHDDGPYTTHRVRGILYKKGGEGIMKEERLSSTSSWSVSSLPAGHV